MTNPITNRQGMPRLDTPVLGAGNLLTSPWYKFLIFLWQASGESKNNPSIVVYFQHNPDSADGLPIGVYDTSSGDFIGNLVLEGGPAPAPEPQVVISSPTVLVPDRAGSMLVFAAEAEISRAGGPWYQVTLNGGMIPMELGDSIRISWFGPSLPSVTFFPKG